MLVVPVVASSARLSTEGLQGSDAGLVPGGACAEAGADLRRATGELTAASRRSPLRCDIFPGGGRQLTSQGFGAAHEIAYISCTALATWSHCLECWTATSQSGDVTSVFDERSNCRCSAATSQRSRRGVHLNPMARAGQRLCYAYRDLHRALRTQTSFRARACVKDGDQ